MSISNMQVFDKYVMPATIERVAQVIELFNAASAGAIRLTAEGFEGDFTQESFFQSLEAAARRVDRYATNSAVTATDLEELKRVGVKVAGGFGPVKYEPGQMTWLQRPTAQGVAAAADAFAEILVKDQLNTAIAAAVAAIENVAGATNDVSASAGISYSALNGSHAKFGDMSGAIVASVMNGITAHGLIGDNLANSERLFEARGVMVIDILNKAVVITDAPALYETGTPNKNKVLSLVEGGVDLFDPGDIITNVETTNGKERIETTFQADYTFGVALKGYSWDTANGGKSPTDAELATGSNWDQVATDIKLTAGVIAIGDAAG
ncbi:MAG: hypothetical protein COB78_10890 [Hyphomicrobiales bacterium]|nr:MAG: hypothetical protein COB78_10890 [Hyphomicrobiales bacterium]